MVAQRDHAFDRLADQRMVAVSFCNPAAVENLLHFGVLVRCTQSQEEPDSCPELLGRDFEGVRGGEAGERG